MVPFRKQPLTVEVMKNIFQNKTWAQGLSVLKLSGDPDDAEDGGDADANPIMPDYANPDSEA